MSETPLASAPVVRIAVAAAAPAPRVPVRRSDALAPLRRLSLRLTGEWLPGLTWRATGTGRPGLIGVALLLASAIFFVSTQLPVAGEVAGLRSDLMTARNRVADPANVADHDPMASIRHLPTRAAMPAQLGILFAQAEAAQLRIDTGKYELSSSKSGDLVRYKISFPVTGSYAQVRQFIDATLTSMPAVAISDLAIERKTIGDGAVEAQVRLTVFTRSTP